MDTRDPYSPVLESIFLSRYTRGVKEIVFDNADLIAAALRFKIKLSTDPGEVIRKTRYGLALPPAISSTASRGNIWRIRPVLEGKYKFVMEQPRCFTPSTDWARVDVCDKTPGIVVRHSLSRYEDLLARVRHNRLISTFYGREYESLQSHVRATVPHVGEVETDEMYVGKDRQGERCVIAVHAARTEGPVDTIHSESDQALCQHLFPDHDCRPMIVQFTEGNVVVLFEVELTAERISNSSHRYFRLVPPDYEEPGQFAGQEAPIRRVQIRQPVSKREPVAR